MNTAAVQYSTGSSVYCAWTAQVHASFDVTFWRHQRAQDFCGWALDAAMLLGCALDAAMVF
jgi:hypothetical protein